MKLGVVNSVWEWAGVKLNDALERIASLGFKYFDVLAYGTSHPKELSSQVRKELLKKIEDLGLELSSMVMLPPNIALSQEKGKALDYLKQCAELQAELGGHQVCLGMGGGYCTIEVGPERAWVNSATVIREFAEGLQKMGIYLALEYDPLIFSVLRDTTSLEKMIAEIEMENVFANIDLGHLTIVREPAISLKKLEGRVLHVHISENDGENHSNDIIGKGVTPVATYIKAVNSIGIEETCEKAGEVAIAVLEIGEENARPSDPDSYVRQSLEYLEKVVPDLTK